MAKRFTDTNKLKKKWLRGLKAPYKLLWVYLLDACDHAGIWEVDFEIANIYIGGGVEEKKAIEILKDKIHIFDNGNKWLIIDFIDFQYNGLNNKNPAHNNVIKVLSKYNLIDSDLKLSLKQSPLKAPLQGTKEKEEEEEEVIVIEEEKAEFEKTRSIYPGTKRGLDTEYNNFKNKHKDWKQILTYLNGSLLYQIEARKKKTGFVPEWANFSTWINQRKFEEEIPEDMKKTNINEIYELAKERERQNNN